MFNSARKELLENCHCPSHTAFRGFLHQLAMAVIWAGLERDFDSDS